MKRRHWLELHEQPWCPAVVRSLATDYLHTATTLARPYRSLVPRLAELVQSSSVPRIVDLCSGGGGPAVQLAEEVAATRGARQPLTVSLTDLFPEPHAWQHRQSQAGVRVEPEPRPIDARTVPPHLGGVRTIFDAFHHFRPDDASAILRDARRARVPILVAEGTERSVAAILMMLLLVPLLVLLFTPAVRPFRWSRLLLTYLVPIAPLLIAYDGAVSCLRTYTPDEMLALASSPAADPAGGGAPSEPPGASTAHGDDGYVWEAGRDLILGRPLLWLTGRPR